MTTALTLTGSPSILAVAGQVANNHAARGLFVDYRARKAANTIKRHEDALALFVAFLAAPGVPGMPSRGDLAQEPAAWEGVTWGLVSTFVTWLLGRGYAISTVNGSLSVVKSYAKLAAQAGAIPAGEWALIRSVTGFRGSEARHVDENRETTRTGVKKADPVTLTKEQAETLKVQPDTPQGRRDALLLGLLLDLGLRCGEAAGLTVTCVKMADGMLTFYRPKVAKEQTHRLTPDLLRTMRAYMAEDAPALGSLLRASNKGGKLAAAGMTERAITRRVGELGARVGVTGLSAHDLRHYWATRAARNGTPLDRLQDAGGWSSPAMPLRYVEAAKIANEGVRLE
jgi:integrase